MKTEARIAAAIAILDDVLVGEPAEKALLKWARNSRFAGSGDRAAVRDLVFAALRRRNSLAASGGGLTGRGLMIGLCRVKGTDPDLVFTGQGHAPSPLTEAERAVLPTEVLDLPDWIVPRWRKSLGAQWQQVANAMRHRAPVWLRVNPLRGDVAQAIVLLAQDEIDVQPSSQLPTALKVTRGERKIARSAAYRNGLVELQDLSPQLACAQLPLTPGARVLDFCAGGGGKALAIAARQPQAILHAHDAHPQRLADVPERARRAGAKIRIVDRPEGRFDLVVADVPCSGSGTWRRTPDAKWRLTERELERLCDLQQQVLAQAADHVAPGGVLAYMTCSVLRDENQDAVERFVRASPQFHQESSWVWNPVTASDGFFAALLRRADHPT